LNSHEISQFTQQNIKDLERAFCHVSTVREAKEVNLSLPFLWKSEKKNSARNYFLRRLSHG